MSRNKQREWRSLQVRCEMVEHIYGSGNFDDAGDALIRALELISAYPGQYRYRFAMDTTHPNPWYHVMIFEIEGISHAAYEVFIEQVMLLGLLNLP